MSSAASMTAPVSRKGSRNVSQQELFYLTRELFRRNKKFVKRRPLQTFTQTPETEDTSHRKEAPLQPFLNTRAEEVVQSASRQTQHKILKQQGDSVKWTPQTRYEQQYSGLEDTQYSRGVSFNKDGNTTFERFFHTSAGRSSQQNDTDFQRSRERFMVARARAVSQNSNNTRPTVSAVMPSEQALPVPALPLQSEDLEQWKCVRRRSPMPDFTQLTSRERTACWDRGNGTEAGAGLEGDDERRFNNFTLTRLKDPQHTFDMRLKTKRDYRVFKCTIGERQSDGGGASPANYARFFLQSDGGTINNCLIDLNKQRREERQFYFKPHRSQLPATILDTARVLCAKDEFSAFKRQQLVVMNHLSGRERPSSSPFQLLKANENVYLHEKALLSRSPLHSPLRRDTARAAANAQSVRER